MHIKCNVEYNVPITYSIYSSFMHKLPRYHDKVIMGEVVALPLFPTILRRMDKNKEACKEVGLACKRTRGGGGVCAQVVHNSYAHVPWVGTTRVQANLIDGEQG